MDFWRQKYLTSGLDHVRNGIIRENTKVEETIVYTMDSKLSLWTVRQAVTEENVAMGSGGDEKTRIALGCSQRDAC